jgi:hypothetical protein
LKGGDVLLADTALSSAGWLRIFVEGTLGEKGSHLQPGCPQGMITSSIGQRSLSWVASVVA